MSPSMGNYLQAVLGGGCPVDDANDLPIVKQAEETSPASSSSRGTVNDHASTDANSNGDRAATISSPISPDSLNFSGLTMADESPRARKHNEERYSHPAQRGSRHNTDVNFYGSPGRDFRGNHRGGAAYGRGGAGGFRNSRTWISPDAQAQQDFLMVRNSMRRLFKNSDVAKWKLADYIAHREAIVAAKAKQLARKAESKEQALTCGPIQPEVQDFLHKCGLYGNFDEVGNLGRALGLPTIWCKDWLNGKDEVSPWPSIAEMKWEGDDRAKTGVGRFLPLPREEGPPGLLWNQLPVVEQYPMDQVCKIPTMEDVYLPVDWDIEEDHEYLWSKDLEQAIDALLDT